MSKTEHAGGRVLLALGVLLAALFVLSFRLGRYGVDAGTTCRILLSPLLPLEPTWTDHEYAAVLNIRLPASFWPAWWVLPVQRRGGLPGVFQNPMASPDVLGPPPARPSGGAGHPGGVGNQGTTLSAFFWSLATVVLVYLVGQRAPGNRVLNLVLAGMVISSLFTAATSYLKLVADPTNQLPEITYWLMGSLSGTRLADVARIAPAMAAGLLPLFLLRWKLNLLTLGMTRPGPWGSTPPAAFSGGGVRHAGHRRLHRGQRHDRMGGLVVPHLCRKLVGSNFKVLLPCSMLAGAAFLLLVDNLSRNLLATEIPIGILTAFTGAPFFLYLMLRKGGAR